jgi:Holliday junction resolvase-like predicted endonuclease
VVNKNYLNGRAREYRLMNALKREGMKVFRMSGSHGEFDLIALNPESGIINFIQVKPTTMSNRAKTRLQSKINWVEQEWTGKAHVISTMAGLK